MSVIRDHSLPARRLTHGTVLLFNRGLNKQELIGAGADIPKSGRNSPWPPHKNDPFRVEENIHMPMTSLVALNKFLGQHNCARA